MSDVHTESEPRKRRRKRKQTDATEQPDLIEFDEAIPKGEKLLATLKSQKEAVESTEMKLGELADRLKPEYGAETVAVFASKIGIPAATLKRYLSVYRAWKGIEAPAPSFAVRQELQDHPEREAIIKQFPTLTKREARDKMRDHRKANPSGDWRVNEMRRDLNGVTEYAQQFLIKYGHLSQQNIDLAVLREAMDDPKELRTWRLCANALNKFADIVESAFTPPPGLPSPMHPQDEAQ